MRSLLIPVVILFCLVSACTQIRTTHIIVPRPPFQVSGELNAAEPAIAASPDSSVFVAWVDHHEDGLADVNVAHFDNTGQKQGETVRVNSQAGVATAWRGDAPMIAVAPDNTVLVTWTRKIKLEVGHATDLFLSVSRDEGRTFMEPVKINDDTKPAVHGMHSLAVDKDGRIYVAWLDERNTVAVPTEDVKMKKGSSGHHMESNREVFIASSTDSGRTFSANKRVATNACPCCKTALAVGPDNRLYVGWRQVLAGNFRHIAVTSSVDQGQTFSEPKIVSDDQWMLAGCPVSGSTMNVSADGVLRVLWYSAGKNGETGVYLSDSRDGGKSFGPRQLMAGGEARGTPVLLSDGSAIVETAGGKVTHSIPSKSAFAIADGGLPAAVVSQRSLITSYVVKDGESQRVWIAFNNADVSSTAETPRK